MDLFTPARALVDIPYFPDERRVRAKRVASMRAQCDARAATCADGEVVHAGRGALVPAETSDAHVVEILRRTTFKLVVPEEGESVIPLRQRIPAHDWVSAILAVRVHAVTSWADTILEVVASNMALSIDDPSIIFVPEKSGSAAVTFSGPTAPPADALGVAEYSSPIGPMVEVKLVLFGAKLVGTIELTISAELIGRTA